jgi:hypothetical protein
MTLNLSCLVVDSIMSRGETAMVKADVERALNYRNRAEQARAVAQETISRAFREKLLKLAVEFDSYAEDIERAAKRPQRSFWKLASA